VKSSLIEEKNPAIMIVNSKSALLIVDVQLDFCPGGALAVPEGDAIIPLLNKYMKLFSGHSHPVFATRDWHARQTKHFKEFGGTWPQHCVQDTKGAQFHPMLALPERAIILSKGMYADGEVYSAFQAVDEHQTGFDRLLRQHGVTSLFIGGLATDYCVKWTVLDALQCGYKTTLLVDAIKGVNIKPGDSEAALDEMFRLGVQKTTFEKLYKAMADMFETDYKKGG
jgi:nicotinamidase/pyrazinamidase